MRLFDLLVSTLTTFRRNRLRSSLILLAIAIGVAAVILLTGLGEGARRYVQEQFSALGTHLLIVLPGRSETAGTGPHTMLGTTTRDLTLEDAMALQRSAHVQRLAPIIFGAATAAWRARERDITVIGSNHELLGIRHWSMQQGRFLPAVDLHRATPVCVIGNTLKSELFRQHSAIGQWLRLGEHRCRVIGILAPQGHSIGVDVDELVITSVAYAQTLFNTRSLFRIVVEARQPHALEPAKKEILKIIKQRHQGEEDVTVFAQDAVVATFTNILQTLTIAVGGIAAISLIVAGVLIMNVMLVSVSQRTAEIGILKALGAPARTILLLFIGEAVVLTLVGTACGYLISLLGRGLMAYWLPAFSPTPPLWSVIGAVLLAVCTGLVFSLWPARRAAQLDPVLALSHH